MSEKTNNQLQELPEKIRNHFRETYKNKCRVATICLVFLSLIFLLTMLIGSTNGSVYLNEFTFSSVVSEIIQTKSVTFTLLGYCINDECTKDVSHDFDKAPTSDQLQSGQVQAQKRGIDINPSGVISSVGNTANSAGQTIGNAANSAGKTIGNTANTVGQTAGNAASTIGNDANGVINDAGNEVNSLAKTIVDKLLSAFDNFVPKEPTNGESGWIARPIITASIFVSIALILLLITNTENRKYCYPSAFILLLISFILNVVSFFITYSLFSLVFDVIGAFPGIGSNQTGPALTLSGFSSLFLFITLSLIIVDGSRKVKNSKNSV